MKARWGVARKIAKRVVVTGPLTLTTPAQFGSGEADDLTDMPLARDPKDGLPLLTGASIAGAARNYLRERELGYGAESGSEPKDSLTRRLFGEVYWEDKKSVESWLTVDDALGDCPGVELRDGVVIDPETRTAKSGGLYDMELLEAGTKFDLRFELAVPEKDGDDLLTALAMALTGFQEGEIGLGTRKRRGLGECRVKEWRVEAYDLKTGPGLLAWIEGNPGAMAEGKTIAEKLGVKTPLPDARRRFTMDAKFRLESSLLIRSGSGDNSSPDMVHLKSRRGGELKPILSGTSLAGAMRARALRIANTVAPERANDLVTKVFGPAPGEDRNGKRPNKGLWASRAVVRESEVEGAIERVQSRVKIDRFTGGSFPTALFEQQVAFGGSQTGVQVWVELRLPNEDPDAEAEIGLMLHVLKDLWTGDLPLGGEASVGRGRLRGLTATLTYGEEEWVISEADGKLTFGGNGRPEALNDFAKAVGGAK